jgi:hypothetical protein
MKRGLDLVTGNTVIKGNTELMRSTILYALEVGKNSKTEEFYNQSISLLGKGAVAYWTGAELGKIPPKTPAPGTILNLSVVSNIVINPGIWPQIPFPVLPNTSNNPYLDAFIFQATIHLITISGLCSTISQYPPPSPPGPGLLPWVGYKIDILTLDNGLSLLNDIGIDTSIADSTLNALDTISNIKDTLRGVIM